MHSFRKLQVYTTARELVKEVYTLLENMPSSERFALSDQLRRESSNIGAIKYSRGIRSLY